MGNAGMTIPLDGKIDNVFTMAHVLDAKISGNMANLRHPAKH
jgi:hypothetical protein